MSEENKQNEQPEVTIGIAGKADEFFIEFADGTFQIPDYVIRGLGGPDKLKQIAPALKERTFQDFLSAFRLTMQKRDLNSFHQRFVANHFRKLF